ncbi:hypothetical protein AB0M91_12850 [Micromonospora rifamycinica]|uniref:hypothetical protein n=1 Tax=Micromonospora rifamycinica TaxID=291594 RepID=UPI00343E30D8
MNLPVQREPILVLDTMVLDWLKRARLDSLDEIRSFTVWAGRLGAGERDLGEASVLAAACRTGKQTETGAGNLIDALRATNARLPCSGAEFSAYARRHRLL